MQKIAIIGGGFSGAMTAWHLSKLGSIEITVIDPVGSLGTGAAYGTAEPTHLLNVPAARMSALPDEPEHFVKWLTLRKPSFSGDPYTFVQRSWYGEYVQDLVRQLDNKPQILTSRCISVEQAGSQLKLKLNSGEQVAFDKVVLALGNFPPPTLHALEVLKNDIRYVKNVWESKPWETISGTGEVILLGTGLTMVDAALAITNRSPQTKIIAISRHGLLPRCHSEHPISPKTGVVQVGQSVAQILSHIRAQIRSASDWRQVIDGVRPDSQKIWGALDELERKRFIRHVRSFWEVHRHRMPPQIYSKIEDLIRCGKLKIIAGRVVEAGALSDRLSISIAARSSGTISRVKCDLMINCLGAESDLRHTADPLIHSMFSSGLAKPGPSGMGLATAANGAVLDLNGEPSSPLYAVGPLRKGELYETTAVPELRVQCRELAKAIRF